MPVHWEELTNAQQGALVRLRNGAPLGEYEGGLDGLIERNLAQAGSAEPTITARGAELMSNLVSALRKGEPPQQ